MKLKCETDMANYEYPGVSSTFNKMGFVFDYYTEYGQAFLEECAKRPSVVLELGAAYGKISQEALKLNAVTYVNDLSLEHLKVLEGNTPREYRTNLHLVPGRFPEMIEFEDLSFSAIYCSNMFHFLTTDRLEEGVRKLYRWLRPGGKVYLITGTPFVRMLESYLPTYEWRKQVGCSYPGYIENMKIFPHEWVQNLPESMLFMDRQTVERVFTREGFHISQSSYIDRHDFPPSMRWDGRENVGLIGCKQ